MGVGGEKGKEENKGGGWGGKGKEDEKRNAVRSSVSFSSKKEVEEQWVDIFPGGAASNTKSHQINFFVPLVLGHKKDSLRFPRPF